MASQQDPTAAQQQNSEAPQQRGALQRDTQAEARGGTHPVRHTDSPFAGFTSPFALMDRLFDQFFGRDLFGRDMFSLAPFGREAETRSFPQLEIAQQGDTLEIRADLPGVRKDDVKVEARDGELVISGERRSEQERREGGFYRSERSYGAFSRTVRLPETAKLDTIEATFENGVLKIQLEVPGVEQKHSRTVEVRDPSETRH
jgi:HSP20 family protein